MESECSDEPLNMLDAPFFVDRFGIDTWDDEVTSLEDMVGMKIDDLPYNVDFNEKTWERVSAEMDQTDDEDSTDVFAEIVEANQKVSMTEMNFYVSPEDILQNLTDEDALIIPRKKGAKMHRNRAVDQADIMNDSGDSGSVCLIKKIKTEPSLEPCSRPPLASRSNSDTQFVFVNDKETNMKKVIPLQRGEELPSRYEIASIQGTLPPLPMELASFPAITLPKLQDLASRQGQPPASSATNPTTVPSPVTETRKNISKTQSPSKTLNSLAVLMEEERRQGGNSSNPLSRNSMSNSSKDSNASKSTNEFSPATKRFVGTEVPPVISTIKVSTSPLQPTSSKSPAPKPSQSVNPVPMYLVLGCKLCGEAFPCHHDHIFKTHLFVKHGMDIDDKQYEDCKVRTQMLLQCKKCKVVLLKKFEEHQIRCAPNLTKETAFEQVNQSGGNWAQKLSYVCGINDCRLVFKMRKDLAIHTENEHKNYFKKMILEPEFRCAQCLKKFSSSFALGQHCTECIDMSPRAETVLELARSLLYCDFCGRKHSNLSDCTSCYFKRQIFRCVLCLAMFRDKTLFFKHLHQYHSLQTKSHQLLALSCPMCNIEPNKYTMIFPHIVTEHLGPILDRNPIPLPPPPPSNTQNPVNYPTTQQKPQRRPSEGSRSTSSPVATTGASTVAANAGNSQTSKKIPDLQPIPTQSVTQAPSGILINTTRWAPIITVPSGLPGIGSTTVVKTSASQVYGHNPIILIPSSSTVSRPSVTAVKQQLPMPPMITNFQQGGNTSPAVRQTMSGLFKQGSPSGVRPTPVGLVRPILTLGHALPNPPTLRTTVSSQIAGRHLPTILPRPPNNASIVSTTPASVTAASSVPFRPSILGGVQVSGVSNSVSTSTGAPPLRPTSVVRAPAGVSSGSVNRFAGRVPVIRQPPPSTASSVLTIDSSPDIRTATAPSSTTSSTRASTPTTVSNTSQSAAAAAASTPATGNNNVNSNATPGAGLFAPANTKPNPNAKPGSRLVTIGGRTYEYQVIQDKLASKPQPQHVTTSSTGLTVARHAAPVNKYRVPVPYFPNISKSPRPVTTTTASNPQQPRPANPSSPSTNVSSTSTNK